MSEKTFEMTMLLDFYGELLTEKQRECMGMHYNEDFSLTEIAEILEITRQGVSDLLTRSRAALTDAEEKIGMVERFSRQRETIAAMSEKLARLVGITSGEARALAGDLRAELETLSI